jgi:hypothetical protein
MNFWNKYFVKMAIPFVVTLVITIGTLLTWMLRRKLTGSHFSFSAKDALNQIYNRSVPLLVVLVITMYSFLISSALSPLKCKYVNDQYIMYDNPSSLCFDDYWYEMLPFVIFFCVLYGIISPGAIIFMFYKNRVNINDDLFVSRFGVLTRNYKEAFFWWDLMPMMKRAIFVVSAAFLLIAKTEVTLSYIIQLFLFCYASLELACSPFKKHYALVSSIR